MHLCEGYCHAPRRWRRRPAWTSIGPIFLPFFAKSGGSHANRNDIYAHVARGRAVDDAASNAPALDAQVATEEDALPALRAQGQLTEPRREALRSSTWQAFHRLMRGRVPDWDSRYIERRVPVY